MAANTPTANGAGNGAGQIPLSVDERHALVESLRIVYPRWRDITNTIAHAHKLNGISAEPQCLLVTGPSGAGKSTLLDSYAARFPAQYTDESVVRPVLQATIPSSATVKKLATMILYGLGDPRAAVGTEGDMYMRILRYMRDCKVEVLMLDELQHFVDQDSQKILVNASNWLKTLIKEAKVACVLAGLHGEAEQVVGVNPQLGRLFGDPYVLEPFEWDEQRPDTITEFRKVLVALEQQLPLSNPSNLADRDMAMRCFAACDGVIAYLMRLVRGATHQALDAGRECLDRRLLAQAYDESLAPERRGIPNPFADGAVVTINRPTNKTSSAYSGTSNAAATNRRSKSRRQHREGITDVL